jgi:fido (protein-threonine AMPylation protein)
MVFIHVKRIGNKKYYSLRISVREDDKVITKDLVNLGSDLSKVKIEDLEKKYKKEIRKSYHTIKKFLDSNYYVEKAKKLKLKKDSYFSKKQLIEIEAVNLHFNNKFLKLDKLTQEEIYGSFLINFAVNSTSIEGNTITLKEAYDLFEEEITPNKKPLRDVYDLINTKNVIKFLNEEKPKINLDLIEKIHDGLLENIDKRKGYRSHEIKIFGQPFKPSPYMYVKTDIKLLLKWYKENENKLNPLILVTLFHHKFEKIHPFSDGNGRTGRVLMNYILSFFNYPPFIISKRFRQEYLKVMNEADNSLKKSLFEVDLKYYKNLIGFIHSQSIYSYWDNFLF